MRSRQWFALSRGRSKHVKASVLYAISLAATAPALARSRCARSRPERELERDDTDIALLKEELSIKDARWGRRSSRRHPQLTPTQRMCIPQVKTDRGRWCEQADDAFMPDDLLSI